MNYKELNARLARAIEERWRDNPSAAAQARVAVKDCMVHLMHQSSVMDEVTEPLVRAVVGMWYAHGRAPATINKRLSCLRALGVDIGGYAKDPKKLKWWLRPEDQKRLTEWLRKGGMGERYRLLADYVDFVCATGLRVEEVLRLKWEHLSFHPINTVMVPGLKTAASQATLPLSTVATQALPNCRLSSWNSMGHEPVFPFYSYDELQDLWNECRTFLGVRDNPGATLKALRRSAARYLHVDRGMPLDVVRQYLRHEKIETTMGYLRLTGGYGTEEMRRWL